MFGLTFTAAGVLTITACGSVLLSAGGLLPPGGHATVIQSLWNTAAASCALLVLGLMHLVIGTLLLCTLRTTFDRARGTVTVRSGWLGLCVQRELLSRYQRVMVEPRARRWFHTCEMFDIVLEGEPGQRLCVGVVTRSHPLARDVASETAEFVRLPRHA